MKKLISIAVALAITLSMLVALPVAAVVPGTIAVTVVDPLAEQLATWTITFQNSQLLEVGGLDYIDIVLPTGAILPAALTNGVEFTMGTGTSAALAVLGNYVPTSALRVSDTQARFYVNAAIPANYFVKIQILLVMNPKSCNHTVTVGTSNCCLQTSNPFPIFTAKIDLLKGKNLISLPSYPADTSIQIVLAALFAEAAKVQTPMFTFSVWYWNSWTQKWVIYASDTSFTDLKTMEAGKAYFVKVSAPISFMFKGEPYPKDQGPPQKWCYPKSWSMIGIPTTTPTYASDYLFDAMLGWPSDNTYAVSTIFGFNNAPLVQQFVDTGWRPGQRDDSTWQYAQVHAIYDDVLLQPKAGYFASFAGEACIIPPIG